MNQQLLYLSTKTLESLYGDVLPNLERYRAGDFLDLVEAGGWSIGLNVDVDLEPLADLDPSKKAETDIENSILVWRALHNLTPALACEDRIWTRLTHVDCLDFSRKRWISAESNEDVAKNVADHFFAGTQTVCRDDNALARLWWNAYIAKDVRPNDQRGALKLMLKRADTRSNFIERTWTVGRPRVAAAILRAMENDEWVNKTEKNYREFMKALNRLGGGVVFELMSDDALDEFMNDCSAVAQKQS